MRAQKPLRSAISAVIHISTFSRRVGPLHAAVNNGHEAVTKQLLAARCNVHWCLATLIRNKKHKSADRGKNDTLVQASPAQTTEKQQEDADRTMKELLEEQDKDAAAAAAVSQKKQQAKKAGKSVGKERRDAADGQDGSQKEEHAEGQKDTERTEATAVPEKEKTVNVAAVASALRTRLR